MPLHSLWLPFAQTQPDARLRLFCLPFAGGGAGVFRPWMDALAPVVEVCPIQLPGRETRFREPAHTRMAPLVAALADALGPYFDRPFALFGHSMGALVAFELARELRQRKADMPVRLIVSGRGAPHLPLRHAPLHALVDGELRAELRRLQGTPDAVLNNDELMQLILPTLRADFAVHETYVCHDEMPLPCPIFAFGGDLDTFAPVADIRAWSEHTTQSFESSILPGGHFFLQTHRPLLLQRLSRYLESVQLA